MMLGLKQSFEKNILEPRHQLRLDLRETCNDLFKLFASKANGSTRTAPIRLIIGTLVFEYDCRSHSKGWGGKATRDVEMNGATEEKS
jgi:hypothetical protein